GQPMFAFAGAMIAVGVVLLLAGGRGRLDPTRAILVGVVVSVLCGGLFVLFVKIFRENPSGGTALDFLFGSVRSLLPSQYAPLAAIMLLGIAGLALSGRALADVAGDETRAATVGSLQRTRWIVLLVASLLVALTAAMAGPIGFVGLIAPHIARLLVGPDPRRVLPVAAFGGAMLVAVTDAVGRSAVQWDAVGSVLPVGVLTNLLGAPFFLVLLYVRRGRVSELGRSA
ncbi:MAG: iron chelate uptake ABC transporter family permease subunit, partial [Planctomycetota bacterium]